MSRQNRKGRKLGSLALALFWFICWYLYVSFFYNMELRCEQMTDVDQLLKHLVVDKFNPFLRYIQVFLSNCEWHCPQDIERNQLLDQINFLQGEIGRVLKKERGE